jgi:hypothetical protein
MNDPVKGDCKLLSDPVVLQFESSEENCTVNELEGSILEEFLDENRALVVTNESEEVEAKKKLASYKGMHEPFVSLIKRCLRGSDGVLITEERIRKFPPRIQMELHKIAQRVNGLVKPDEESTKN